MSNSAFFDFAAAMSNAPYTIASAVDFFTVDHNDVYKFGQQFTSELRIWKDFTLTDDASSWHSKLRLLQVIPKLFTYNK